MFDVAGDQVDHITGGDNTRHWACLKGRQNSFLAEETQDDITEGTTLPYAVWQTKKDAEGERNEYPLVHLAQDDPEGDHAALMQHVKGMMKKLGMGYDEDDEDEEDDEDDEVEGGEEGVAEGV